MGNNMNDTIFVITAFYIGFNSRGDRVRINERMAWCSTKDEAIGFINDSYNMDYFVRRYCRYVVIEEVQKLYGPIKAIGWWEGRYNDNDIYPTMVRLDKSPIENYEEEDENRMRLVSL
jgi:hypothetical protein